MIVCMLGLENAANLLKGEAGPFSDVAGTHWASGYINVAEMKGIVGGYPDGTFKPEGTITYAEALKMILAAMGYLEDGFLVVRWPVTWIIQATEVGLDDGVEVLANLPISRGEVAKLFDNSLTKAHVKVTEHGFEERDPEVSFMGKLGVSPVVGQVTGSPELWDNTTGKVQVTVKSKTGETHEDFSIDGFEGLLGHKVKVWRKGSKVLAVEDLSTEKVLTLTEYGRLEDLDNYFVNHTVGAKGDVKTGHEIVAVYDGSKAIAVKSAKYEIGKVKDIYAYGKTRKDIYLDDNTLRLAEYDVEYEGAVESFSDIKKDDVIHYLENSTYKRAIIVVVRDVVEGKLTEITYDGKLKVDGKAYTLSEKVLADDVVNLIGGTVTLYLNKDGKVFRVDGDAPEVVTAFYGVIQATQRKWDSEAKKTKLFAKVLTSDGDVEYVCEDASVGKVVYAVVEDEVAEFDYSVPKVEGTVTKVDSTNKKITVVLEDETTRTLSYTDKALWLEGDDAPYDTRPRPYTDDKVVLYLDGDVIVVGMVVEE